MIFFALVFQFVLLIFWHKYQQVHEILQVLDLQYYPDYEPANPYHIALGFGLERIYRFLNDNKQSNLTTYVVVEKRGKVEDNELELEFRRICDGHNWLKSKLPLEIIFSDKKCNAVGLQIADLIARPIGLSIFKEQQPKRAYDVIKDKFRANAQGNIKGYGLKVFPYGIVKKNCQ
jgi:hypothetical protein